ncbi:hypothetical protein Aspvir_009114 [Aspergillus viridinutans]|uniref:Uncharacterized protein n=1 Tax=Aspergillus viridinutans TaxID=75553 RepID=A0A9P3BXW4_ASPVI|nr:uncharacterized protein Aspvir_009114 [Aspergillus viridinutans]GIK05015.1 hypothetical protein Aspvir_009114 [Aspergillus viridinutans]
MDNDQEFNGIRLQFALDGTAVAILCFCFLLMALPRSPVVRGITHHMYGDTGHCPGCRCACVTAGPTAPSSSNGDDEDEDKEDDGNDEEGG